MEGRRVVVSALQFACCDDISANVDTAERLVRAAHGKGANIILIQELFEGYYFCQAQREDFFQRAKPHKGHPTILRMRKLAKELGVVIPVSFFEEANNAHYNSIAIIDADGADLGLYGKSYILDGLGYQEKFYFNPGDTGFKQFAGISGFQKQPELWFFKVNPGLYKDNKTRLFTFLNAGASQCFNTLCPGFLYVDTGIPLDSSLEPVSRREGTTYHYHFFLLRDTVSGKWWLEIGENRTTIGFWPQSIFTGLADLATFAEWGGELFSPPAQPSPPMGSGFLPIGNTRFDGFASNIVVVNESNWALMPENTETYADNKDYYDVWDAKGGHDIFGLLVLYGGHGGLTGE